MYSLCSIVLFSSTLLSLLLLQSSSQILEPSPAPTPSNLLEDICSRTINSTFCLQTIGSDPRIQPESDLLKVAKISLQLAEKDSKDVHDFLEAALRNKTTDPALKPVLRQCVDSYEAIKASFWSAYEELEEDSMTANYDVSVSIDYIVSCEKALSDAAVRSESAVSSRIEVTRCFYSMGTVVTDAVWDSHYNL